MNYKILKEKFLGSILGTAVGDALGKPLEGLSKLEIKNKHGKVEQMIDGRYTNNTQMMKAVAESLIQCKGFDIQHMANQLVKNYQPSRGYEYELVKALKAVKANKPLPFDSLGNASASRIAPIGLFYFDDSHKQEKVAKDSSGITHSHPLTKEGCWLFARSIGLALVKEDRRDILVEISNISKPPYKETLGYAASVDVKTDTLYSPAKLAVSSNIWHSLGAVAYPAFFSSNFKEALIYIVNLGGDTSTLGAMCGALTGAYWGIKAIPSEWLDPLEDREYLEKLAENLFRVKADQSKV